MPGESTPPYTQFPQEVHLCEARIIQGDYVKFCFEKTNEGHDMCPWHENMRAEHIKKGDGDRWEGLEVTLSLWAGWMIWKGGIVLTIHTLT